MLNIKAAWSLRNKKLHLPKNSPQNMIKTKTQINQKQINTRVTRFCFRNTLSQQLFVTNIIIVEKEFT